MKIKIKKYITIVKTEVHRQFVYRISILGYVGGNFLELFAQFVVWSVIFRNADVVRGYTYEEMVTYIVVGWIFMFMTTNYSFESRIARDIHLGTLANFITKPIDYLRYVIFVSLGRVTIAFFIVLAQGILYVALFHKLMIFDLNLIDILIVLIMLVFSYFIKLFFAFLVGIMAFWTTEINGIYRGYTALSNFLSGALFPLSLLPVALVNVSLFFPFVYTFFVPVQFYLGKISRLEALRAIGVEIVWLFLLYFIIRFVWKKGLKKYESVGI